MKSTKTKILLLAKEICCKPKN